MLVVNGRFLRATPTGLHRTARSLLDATRLAHPELGLAVWAPPGVGDLRVDRRLPGPAGRRGDQVWEQTVLPAAARARPVLSLTNTGPLLARRTAVMVHDLAPLVGPEWFARSMRAYARVVLGAARRAELVLTVSGQVAGELAAAGVAPGRIRTVRPAVDPSFAPAPAAAVTAARERLGLPGRYLLLVGWADPRKGAATAVAAHLAAARDVPHQLVLVGLPHPVFAPVRLPDAPSVVRPGYVDEPTLRALLTGAAALVYPSHYEGFGLPPLEAWACGTPAVVGDTPALRESTQGRACYAPPGDVPAWTALLRAAAAGDLPLPAAPQWTWADAATQLAEALARLN